MPFFTESDSTIEGPEIFSAVISNAPARVSLGASIATVDITEEQCECNHADVYKCACVVKDNYRIYSNKRRAVYFFKQLEGGGAFIRGQSFNTWC